MTTAMLIDLTIRDFAIIDQLQLAFQPGMNSLTGATGAGKSIIIDALGAVLGDRIGADVVRSGTKAARIEASFDVAEMPHRVDVLALLNEMGIEPDGDQILLGREISAAGRSIARINGRATTATALARIGALLVDIHGQSDHLSLLRPAEHLRLLDRFAGLEDERSRIGADVRELNRIRRRIEEITAGAMERARQVDLLQFQIAEINAAELTPGEDAVLASERAMLANAEHLTEAAVAAHHLLAGGDEIDAAPGAAGSLGNASARLHEIAAIDESAAALAAKCDEIGFLLDDLIAEVRAYEERVEANPDRLEEVDERLDLIKSLKRKYGATVEDVIAFGERSSRELAAITGGEADVASLQAQEAIVRKRLSVAAQELSIQRAEAANALSQAVEQSIAELNMGRSRFVVSVSQRDEPGGLSVALPVSGRRAVAYDESGVDQVEFLLAPNAGETLKPLARVASGGETARLMLALKSILAAADSTPTLVFDEVDVGVGGRSGQVVGEKLWALSEDHQVLVITHLAQIAAFGETHFMIEKSERDDRTSSGVRALEDEERIDELAAMLDGLPPSDPSREAARVLMARIARWKAERSAETAIVYSSN